VCELGCQSHEFESGAVELVHTYVEEHLIHESLVDDPFEASACQGDGPVAPIHRACELTVSALVCYIDGCVLRVVVVEVVVLLEVVIRIPIVPGGCGSVIVLQDGGAFEVDDGVVQLVELHVGEEELARVVAGTA